MRRSVPALSALHGSGSASSNSAYVPAPAASPVKIAWYVVEATARKAMAAAGSTILRAFVGASALLAKLNTAEMTLNA